MKNKNHKKPAQPAYLAHRKHTGKKLPRSQTSYALLFFILLVVGALIANVTIHVQADYLSVMATADGPMPTQPATITSPTDGQTFTSVPVDVQGDCESGGFLVKLYRNGLFSGGVLCDASGHFLISSGLFPGSNDLEAKIFDGLDRQGPTSPHVSVSYQPPVQPTGSPGSTQPTPAGPVVPGPGIPFPYIKAELSYKGYTPGTPITWPIDIEGGTAPYALNVAWGDGKSDVYSVAAAGKFNLTHSYGKPGAYHGQYILKLSLSDAKQQKAFLQLIAIVNDSSLVSLAGHGIVPPPSSTSWWQGLLTAIKGYGYMWTAYATAMLMVVSFWLGERHETWRMFRHMRHQH